MFDDINDLYQQVIIDHSKNPRNYGKLPAANRVAEGRNPLCGDQVTVYIHMDDGDIVQDIRFEGSGCAIFKASASLMTTVLKGRTKQEAEKIFDHFHAMITTGADRSAELGKLGVFAGVNKFPSRVKCAILPWHAVNSTLKGENNIVSTE